jgi:hypothetical protein
MPSVERQHSPEEVARLATEIYERQIRPSLRPEDDGKMIAIDITSGDFELDDDDYTAVMRIRGRRPTAEIWLGCVGQPAACRMRWAR